MYKNDHYPFQMIKLPYEFSELTPFLSFENIKNHYLLYYQGYLNRLNSLLAGNKDYQNLTLDELLFNSNLFPKDIAKEINFNAGGVHNHQLFFESMSPKSKLKNGPLKDALIKNFGSIDAFYEQFKTKAKQIIGSGYLFLVCDEHGELSLFPCINQDTPVPFNLCPILAIDLWEHAYYLDYLNNKEAYIDNFLSYIDFDYVEKQLTECLKFIEK